VLVVEPRLRVDVLFLRGVSTECHATRPVVQPAAKTATANRTDPARLAPKRAKVRGRLAWRQDSPGWRLAGKMPGAPSRFEMAGCMRPGGPVSVCVRLVWRRERGRAALPACFGQTDRQQI
jgi:hypothetical protein